MHKMAAIIVFGLIIMLCLAGFAAVEAASINGYTDNRRNTASNFDMPEGDGFAEYTEGWLEGHSWDFGREPDVNNGYPAGDNSALPINIKGDDFKTYLYSGEIAGTSPMAEFEIQIIKPDGEIRSIGYCMSGSKVDYPSVRIDAQVGDTLRLADHSQPSPGQSLTAWDFQWVLMRVGPQGQFKPYVATGLDPEVWPDGTNAVSGNIMASSRAELESYASEIELTEPGYLQMYLSVMDNFDCGPNGSNWSTNGNYVVKGTPNSTGFPWYCWWYYTSLIVEVQPAAELDLFTTGMGSPTWQPEYVVERRYSATPDPVTGLYNRANRVNIIYSFANDSDQDMIDVPVKIVACYAGDRTGAGGYVLNAGTVSIPAGERTENTELVVDYDKLGLGREYTEQLLVAVMLDPDNQIPESNEDNNIVIFRAGDTRNRLSVDVYSPPEGFPVNSTGWATIKVSREDTRETEFDAILTYKLAGGEYTEVPLHVPPGKGQLFATTVERYSAVPGARLVSAWVTWEDNEASDEDAIRHYTNYSWDLPSPPEHEDDVIVDINGS